MNFTLKTPEETSTDLSKKVKTLRLLKKWKRSTLALRSGVTQSSLRRFEQTGKVSLNHFLKLIHALGRLDETESLLNLPAAQSLKELKKKERKISKRGTI
ncbi:MAG: helix-turn-helix transcriptional regulator [Deltaproteobacteria bacterium]|uniref:helix-turn-helix domain-containing protein n=1 Tax=Desulfobacula sp. TaxID=2593537 RepID=UPI0019916DAC|nr:helix-turn-helix transcriptional regulator [Candidatus Desulfobacula maris]MBL6992681.1 helix-turn-helix transcriptional regulator [Desulfobacula sp.]